MTRASACRSGSFPEWLRAHVRSAGTPRGAGSSTSRSNRFAQPGQVTTTGTAPGGAPRRRPGSIPRRLPSTTPRRLPVAGVRPSGPVRVSWPLALLRARASLETANLWVRCAECDAQRSMVEAVDAREAGRFPPAAAATLELDRFEADCTEHMRAILLGASNGWFPPLVEMARVSVPGQVGRLDDLVEEHWGVPRAAPATAEVLKAFRATGRLGRFLPVRRRRPSRGGQQYRARLAGAATATSPSTWRRRSREAFAIPGGGRRDADLRVTADEVPAGVRESRQRSSLPSACAK